MGLNEAPRKASVVKWSKPDGGWQKTQKKYTFYLHMSKKSSTFATAYNAHIGDKPVPALVIYGIIQEKI